MIERLRAIPDRRERLKETHKLLIEIHDSVHPALAELRRDDVVALHVEEDVTYVEIAKLLNISKMSAGRIANTKLRREGQPTSEDGAFGHGEQATPSA